MVTENHLSRGKTGRMIRKIGILTGGGDCPGLNAVIQAVVQCAAQKNVEVMGVRGGWRGFLENDSEKLTRLQTHDILSLGGTILGTTRINPTQVSGGPEKVEAAFKRWRLDGLIVVGGEGTMSLARIFHERGLPIVGVPKTIDNDLAGTDFTFGFDTAVSTATDAIDRLRTTAESHERVMVVEVMGRHAGWIALYAGLAGGADVIGLPEEPLSVAHIVKVIQRGRKDGQLFSIVVLAEGVFIQEEDSHQAKLIYSNENPDAFGRPRLGGVGPAVARMIEAATGMEARFTVLGHVQRGGTPTPRDRVLALRFGAKAIELLAAGKTGRMVALKGDQVESVSLEDATHQLKTVNADWLNFARMMTK
jgi:ATP-dependent phosphofructokinase / diphosphate-dependent phosphofructokinase